MMRGDVFIAEAFAQMSRHAFSHAAGVDENEGGLVLLNQRGHAVVDFFPDFVRRHGFQWRAGNLDRQIEFARVPGIDDRAAGPAIVFKVGGSDQKPRDFFDRFLRCRKADAHQRLFDQRLKSFD